MEKNGSRLLQMQAKFQQKQLQEREMKIASLYEAQQARALDRVRHSPSSGTSAPAASSPPQAPPVHHQPGKVRQMFEERRTKAGIDKSYPLQPIHNTDRPAAKKSLPNGYTKVNSTHNGYTKVNSTHKVIEKRNTRITTNSQTVKKQQHKIEHIVNGSGDLNHNHEPDLNSIKHTMPQSNGEIIPSTDELDKVDNNYMIENETFPEALAPIPTPQSPEPRAAPARKQTPTRNPVPKTSGPVKTRSQPVTVTPPRKVTGDNTVTQSSKARGAMQRTANPVPRRNLGHSQSGPASKTRGLSGAGVSAGSAASTAAAGVPCAVCGRRFAPDRLDKHQEICRKAQTKKRKPFDALKHRLAGTEAEPFINKLRKHGGAAGGNPSSTKVNAKPLNNNWRQKHEEFIQAIRAAKEVQAHLNAGGKLSDLPPPPPSENPDYVQCPHCNRRFNQGAAERHIPKCASYQFNKPKPVAKRR